SPHQTGVPARAMSSENINQKNADGWHIANALEISDDSLWSSFWGYLLKDKSNNLVHIRWLPLIEDFAWCKRYHGDRSCSLGRTDLCPAQLVARRMISEDALFDMPQLSRDHQAVSFGGHHTDKMTFVSSHQSDTILSGDSDLAVTCPNFLLQLGTHAPCGQGDETARNKSADTCRSHER
ncbi:hypothetical protein PIB30_091920, partial [Stylosanthes scabra]|nr:hypothetical protein [Stylosanthes scabra]